MCHQDDAESVCLAVSELHQKLFNPVMVFKSSGRREFTIFHATYTYIPKIVFLLVL